MEPKKNGNIGVTEDKQTSKEKAFLRRALEATIRIGLVVLLVLWCFEIVKPFIVPVIWGIIIAVATYPGYRRLLPPLGDRRGLAAAVVALLMLVLLIGPTIMLADTLVAGAQQLARELGNGTLRIPPPPESVATWPVVGTSLSKFWELASVNLASALNEIGPQLKAVGGWLLSAAGGVGFGILQFIFAIIIAGILLANAEGGDRAADSIANRLMGEQGWKYSDLARTTVRGVARGILGVALIQSILAGLGFLVIGLPAAGLLALLCLVLAVVQVGVGPIVIPAVIYVFATADTVPAVLFLVWSLFVTLLDNFLKPILLGRGAKVPMAVIFVGAIGGFLAHGIVGLFVGAVVLSLGYTLFRAWLGEETAKQMEKTNPGTGAGAPSTGAE
jgi:predicted PurR-regulated permease PerM